MDGYVARFDSDVIGDSGVMPNTFSYIPHGQLSKDKTASETALTSRAVLSSKPVFDFKHIMPNTIQNAGTGCCNSVVDNVFAVNISYICCVVVSGDPRSADCPLDCLFALSTEANHWP